jgi:hypothetical protein
MLHQDTHGIGSDPDKCRMAKTDHAAKSQDQVQAAGGQRKNQNSARHADIKLLAHCLCHPRQQKQQAKQRCTRHKTQRVIQ